MLAVSPLLTDPAAHNWKTWLGKEEVTTDSFERNVFYREDTTVLKRDAAAWDCPRELGGQNKLPREQFLSTGQKS